jgi:hypothetical protein
MHAAMHAMATLPSHALRSTHCIPVAGAPRPRRSGGEERGVLFIFFLIFSNMLPSLIRLYVLVSAMHAFNPPARRPSEMNVAKVGIAEE